MPGAMRAASRGNFLCRLTSGDLFMFVTLRASASRVSSEEETALHGEELGDRSEHERGEERQCAHHQDGAEPKRPELQVSVRRVPRVAGTVGFAANDPATAIMKMIGG